MASRSAPPCTHELRPGTAVCLRCQHAERAAKQARQRQLLARGAAGTLVLAVIAAVGVAGATAIRARVGAKSAEPAATGNASLAALTSATDSASVTTQPPAPDSATPASRPSIPPATRSASAGISPVVPVGRTTLRDTIVADRAGDTVRVSFDLVLSRTRRPEKFEAIVRSTLPQVYGAAADSALRALPVGTVARAGDLVTTLTERGIQIPLAGGRTIALWPETRDGRDGPLVVAYRAVAR
jgi:hypothetical protein